MSLPTLASTLLTSLISNKTKLSVILEALQWIINPDSNPNTDDGAEIITHSWGYTKSPIGTEKPLWDATIALKKMNVLNVFPAGDNGPKIDSLQSPGAYPHVIAEVRLIVN